MIPNIPGSFNARAVLRAWCLLTLFLLAALTPFFLPSHAEAASDNFNRASIGSNWTMLNESLVISGSTVVTGNTGRGENVGYWNADSFRSDQYSQVKLGNELDGGGPIVRVQSPFSFYLLYVDTTTHWTLFKVVNGTFFVLTGGNTSFATGDKITLDITRNVLTGYKNGVPIPGASYTETDSPLTGGAPGIHVFNTIATFDDWQGGSRITLLKPPNNLGLVGYWSFDEGTSTKATDFSGNGNTGTVNGSPIWVNGKRGKALSFDGGTSYVDVGDQSSLDPQNVSACAWAKRTGVGDGNDYQIIIHKQQWADAGYTLGFGPEFSTVSWRVLNTFSGATHDIAASVTTSDWHHYCGVFDSAAGITYLYVDGVLRNSKAASMNNTSTENFRIGVGDFAGYFQGSIDEVRIYNRALSAGEVAKLYGSGAVKINANSKTLTQGSTLENGLVGLWTFDGGDTNWTSTTAGVVYDRSGNNNTGTLTNMNRATSPTAGHLGQALDFDGSTTFVAVPTASSIDFGASQDFAVSAWVKTTQPAALNRYPGIVSKDNNAGASRQAYGLTLHNSTFDARWIFGITVSGTGYLVYGTNNIADGNWHHIVGVRSGSTIITYEDGAFANTAAGSSGSVSSSVALDIGVYSQVPVLAAGGAYLDGSIDDVRIYNRALTPAEVKQLYKLGTVIIRQ